MNIGARVITGVRSVERTLIAAIMLGMSGLFFVNVIVRELAPQFASNVAWIEEATLFALAWLVFLGLGLALERRRHVAMTAILDGVPPRVGRVIHFGINSIGLLFAAFLTKVSFDLAAFIYSSGQLSPTLNVSMLGLYAPLPIGFALLSLRYLLELFQLQDRFQLRDAPSEH